MSFVTDVDRAMAAVKDTHGGLDVLFANAGDPLYLATKAAVRSLARGFAGDEAVRRRGVRVNVVSPGAT